MDSRRLRARSPLLVSALGAALFAVALFHHAGEVLALARLDTPVVALFLDGAPALGLVYGGYRLLGADLAPADRWTVSAWCFAGAALFAGALGVTLLVRTAEGRVVAEPLFPLLVATGAGAIAGTVAGYYAARARTDARRARTVSEAFAFVNHLIRHDLRNDLTVIRGQAQLLDAAETGDGGETGEPSVVSEKANEALDRIEITRGIAETLTDDPDLERIDLAAVVADIAPRIGDAFEAEVRTDLTENAPVAANAGIRSVVDNLIENAAEHNDADDPRIEVGVEAGADAVRLTVRDNGSGIPDEQREHLFDPPETRSGGGLHLVRTLTERYGGRISVSDNDPHGSVFTVEFPRADAAD